MARLSVAVLGPGGVGGLLGALLARAGDHVLVLAGPETSRKVAASGLHLESERFGSFDVAVEAVERLSRPVDVCFVTVKNTQLRDAVARVPAEALGTGLVVPMLNGIEHPAFLCTIYPASSVVAATIRVETTRVAPGVIRHTSPFTAVDLAAAPDNRDRVEDLAGHLKALGVSVRVRDDELAMLWDKFALLEPMALLTTHERANAGVIRTKRREDAIALIAEVAAVAHAEGVAIDADAVLRQLDSVPATMQSSMQRDREAGRPLELDALGGALLRRAGRHGVATPVTARLVSDLAAVAGRSSES